MVYGIKTKLLDTNRSEREQGFENTVHEVFSPKCRELGSQKSSWSILFIS
jgi:hypothetical protein